MYIVELTPTTGQQARGGIALAWAIFNDFTNLMSLEAKTEKKKKNTSASRIGFTQRHV